MPRFYRLVSFSFFLGLVAFLILIPACTPYLPINPSFPIPTPTPLPLPNCAPITTVIFQCSLDSLQPAYPSGGILNLGTNAAPILPLALNAVGFNGAKIKRVAYTSVPYGSGDSLQQVADFTVPVDSANPIANVTTPLVVSGAAWPGASAGTGYAWLQESSYPPACHNVVNLVDNLGHTRQIFFYLYQVNDLGTYVNQGYANPQVAYAWYAFDATGNVPPSNASLMGGSGILEPAIGAACVPNRGTTALGTYAGDLVYFNSDGTLASMGGVKITGGGAIQVQAMAYLPAYQGSTLSPVAVNFGTAGLSGYGKSNGLHAALNGILMLVNGVEQYVPSSICASLASDP